MNLINRVIRFFSCTVFITITSLILLEIVFRLLPVSQSFKLQQVNNVNPIAHFKESRNIRKQIGFNFSHVTEKHSNNYGFLSDYDFQINRGENSYIVAIIGDSYVEAMQVENEDTFHGKLSQKYPNIDFYPIAMSGAPLSQYLAYAKFANDTFNPSQFIFVIISNDFDESWLVYTSNPGFHFFDDNENLVRIDYTPSIIKQILRESAFFRYLYLDLKIHFQLGRLLDSISGKNLLVDVHDKDLKRIEGRLSYSVRSSEVFLRELKKIVNDKHVLLVLDGDRSSIYEQVSGTRDTTHWRNKAFEKLKIESNQYENIRVLDMHEIFLEKWRDNQQRYEYSYDWHWNEWGHKVAADAIDASRFLTIK